ncbi:hypothetical protein [Helicobacter japonicus]|uniref:hypothetical protein n=1 Tax=Helicobacter japonicus TaxID=425400 RepID=UPI0023CA099D|nr:hypothetical protein [Helicobacter japonicus]MDE7235281.1 hypothetical protein [Helicobacter japonicus]
MGYLIFLLTLLLLVFIFVLLSKYKEQISRKSKIIIGICFLALAGLIGIYNILQENESEKLNALKSAFLREKPIECKYQGKDMIVSAKDFNLSNGTMSFQGKSNASFSHIVIPLQDCVLKEQNTESSPQPQESNTKDISADLDTSTQIKAQDSQENPSMQE